MHTAAEKLAAGQKIYGTMLRVVRSPAAVQLIANGGLDFFLCDCEHAEYSAETLHDLFLAGRALGLSPMAWVPACTKEWVSRLADLGAAGIMVPMTETAGQAREIVRLLKYPPLGERGYAGAGAHVAYRRGLDHTEVMARANRRMLAIAQIETAAAIENCEAIAQVEGLDALIIGPNDLSISLGIPGQMEHPKELAAIRRVAAACRDAGKFFGIHGALALSQQVQQVLDPQIMMVSTDVDLFTEAFAGILASCRAAGLAGER